MEELDNLEFPLVGLVPITANCPPLIVGAPPIDAILELATTLAGASSRDRLAASLSTHGTHFFEDVVDDLEPFCDGEGQGLSDEMEILLDHVKQDHRSIVREVVLGWHDFRLKDRIEIEKWIDSELCEKLRKASLKAALILLGFLPLTSDGQIILFREDFEGAVKAARAKAVAKSARAKCGGLLDNAVLPFTMHGVG